MRKDPVVDEIRAMRRRLAEVQNSDAGKIAVKPVAPAKPAARKKPRRRRG